MGNAGGIHEEPGIFQDEVVSKMRKYFLYCRFHYLPIHSSIHFCKAVSMVIAIQQKLN